MRFSLVVAALAPVLSASAADILVTVGGGGLLAFNPTNVTAEVGDTISFQFQSKNHSVTQSTFANPCQIQTTPAQGIDSGFQFVDNTSSTVPQFSFKVDNTSAPLWFFCAQTAPVSHCQKGMVFSVNAKPDGPKSFAVYQAAAMGNPADIEASAAAAASATGGANPTNSAGGAAGGAPNPTDSAGGAAGGAPNPTDSAGNAAATDGSNGANPINSAAGGLTGASPSAGAGNGTAPSAGFRVSGSAMSLVAAVGLTAMLL